MGLNAVVAYQVAAALGSWQAAMALVVVFAFGLSWAFTTVGLLMRSPSAVMNTGFMALFPLIFLSNVFVEPTTLPGWLEGFVDVNPITHLVDGVRSVMAGTPDGTAIMWVLIESVAFVARESELVDQSSGVSARLTIAAMELLHSNLERRAAATGDTRVFPRLSDFSMILPAITGKVEMVYEGEQQGAEVVARKLIGEALAKLLGVKPVIFPGDHGGFAANEWSPHNDPAAFAATLRELLDE